jgi:hypothetical protein
MEKTLEQYNFELDICRDLFGKKTRDYGTAWRILRPSSLTDQIFIKAQRIRTLQEKGVSKVGEGIRDEFIGIVNYSIMALIQCQLDETAPLELLPDQAQALYDQHAFATRDLMMKKNHDYGEAWRNMRVSSLTDLILMKILRIKQIEDNAGKTLVSEGIEAGYADMVNYSIFALILLRQEEG